MLDYLEIRNGERVLVGIIDLFASVIWSEEYYGAGEFEVFVNVSERNKELLRIGHYVTRPDAEGVGIIERVEETFDQQNGKMLTASGRFAVSLLDRRVIYRLSGTQNRPTVMRGNVETAVRSLITNNAISPSDSARVLPVIGLGAVAGITKTIINEEEENTDKQTTVSGLLEFTTELLREYELGARMVLDEGSLKLLYHVYEGADRSVDNTDGNIPLIFSQEFDNLVSSEYMEDISTLKTTALIGGEGEGLARFYTMLGATASGMERREVFVDASSVNKTYKDDSEVERTYSDSEYTSLLRSTAKQEMANYRKTVEFRGDIDVTNCQYRYREDYNLGDVVTIRDDDFGVYLNARCEVVTEARDESGYSIKIDYNTQGG